MASFLDAILGMSGQERTEALRQFGRDLEYYVPPELRGILGLAAEMTPTATLERAAQAGGEMLAPDRTAMERLGSAGQMLSETAGVAAPMMVAGRAAMPAAQALQEGLLGFSVAADDVGRRFVERMNQPGPVPTASANFGGLFGKRPVSFEDAPMIVHHNLSPENLALIEQTGGLPMPSIAISNANQPMSGFGDISLLLAPEKIAPRRDLPVYKADAYTGRQPRAVFEFADPRSAEKAIALDPNFSHMKDAEYWMDAYDDFSNNDRMMRTAQHGINTGISNPKDFDRFEDYVRDVQKKLGYMYDDELAQYEGLSKYGDVKPMLYPEDRFTPSGNRRKPKPYTAEEAFKRMAKARASEAGSEGGQGPGLLRAVLTDKFKNLEDIKANRGLLVGDANQMADVKGAWDSVSYDAVGDVAEYFNGRRGIAEDYLVDLAMGRPTSWADASPETRRFAEKTLKDLKKEVSTMPTEYFEAKPRSMAQVADFDRALIPQNRSDIADQLRRMGLSDIVEYGNEEDRQRLMRAMREFLFAAPPVAAAGAGLLSQQDQEVQ